MANPSKAQFLADVLALLKKRYKIEPTATKLSVLEAIVYAICHENATMAEADAALAKFKSPLFFDWNEVRVSSVEEIRVIFAGMQDDEPRAQRLRRFLRQLFEKTYAFDLNALTKKPLKDSLKTLQEYEAFQSDYLLASVTRLALGGHAIGLDEATLRVLERLGITPTDGDIPALRGSIERAIPKNRGAEFAELLEEVASDVCWPKDPNCPECELKKICPTGQARLAKGAPVADPAAVSKSKGAAKPKSPEASASPAAEAPAAKAAKQKAPRAK